jgi:H+-transporting ATPase
MSAVEEMAGMNILCSDKTGTLTLNKLTVDVANGYPMSGHNIEEVCALRGSMPSIASAVFW